ncbi:DUF411 domain-containing protein [Agrobacterium burrii]|uniref:DUF411 domain-containing protein n=1 Tax=Agrobacterium burrii TaxID=2815339 RepID=A0ABS3ERP9_9HYPH|nr:DUF411 domain-containing protein [Agrobacterium burrii]MBO0134654.1 DUF411 domain-containing protein [Agrobacterium burrii]
MRRRQFIFLSAAAVVAPAGAMAQKAAMTVHKDPYCGCCGAWAKAFGVAGYRVETRDEDDMDAFKARLKVPDEVRGCHTAMMEGYYLEGHVPLEAAERLLKERPALAGLAVAGMPKGSMGMGTDPAASYDVMAVPRDGSNPYVYMAVRPS